MDVNVIEGLHNVRHQTITADSTKVRADIERLVGASGLDIEPLFLDVPTFVDDDEPDHPEGIAFAVSKFDPRFTQKLDSGTFRYRDREIQEVLAVIITENDLVPLVHWDRGMGVFVFNLYFRGA